MKKLIACMVALGFVGLIAGCNTVEGMGKDVEKGGEKVQNAAEKAKY